MFKSQQCIRRSTALPSNDRMMIAAIAWSALYLAFIILGLLR